MARFRLTRSVCGIVCDSSDEAVASAMRAVLSGDGPGSGTQESSLDEHGWDAATGKAAKALGVDFELLDRSLTEIEPPGMAI
jgi:hypothetical protein